MRCGCVAVPVNWFFDIISSLFAKFKNVVHSFEPGETPSNSASHQAPNYVQRYQISQNTLKRCVAVSIRLRYFFQFTQNQYCIDNCTIVITHNFDFICENPAFEGANSGFLYQLVDYYIVLKERKVFSADVHKCKWIWQKVQTTSTTYKCSCIKTVTFDACVFQIFSIKMVTFYQ